MQDTNIFWVNNPSVLFTNGNYLLFFPRGYMSFEERLNAITRFCIYLSILIFLTKQDKKWYRIPVGGIILTIIIYIVMSRDENMTNVDNKKQTKKIHFNNDVSYIETMCRQPTSDNPFMNLSLNDTMLDEPPQACNADDDKIKDKSMDMFNADLFRDTSDLFERKNNQRQFYTVPQPVNPPDSIGLSKWLYGGAPSCKADQKACYEYTRHGSIEKQNV